MIYKDALDVMRSGGKVRLPDWNDENYAFFAKPGGLVISRGNTQTIQRSPTHGEPIGNQSDKIN